MGLLRASPHADAEGGGQHACGNHSQRAANALIAFLASIAFAICVRPDHRPLVQQSPRVEHHAERHLPAGAASHALRGARSPVLPSTECSRLRSALAQLGALHPLPLNRSMLLPLPSILASSYRFARERPPPPARRRASTRPSMHRSRRRSATVSRASVLGLVSSARCRQSASPRQSPGDTPGRCPSRIGRCACLVAERECPLVIPLDHGHSQRAVRGSALWSRAIADARPLQRRRVRIALPPYPCSPASSSIDPPRTEPRRTRSSSPTS